MKAPAVFAGSLLCLSLAGVCAWQHFEVKAARTALASLEVRAAEQSGSLEALRKKAEEAERQKEWIQKESEGLRARLEKMRAAQAGGQQAPAADGEAEVKPEPGGFRRLLGEAMRDPFLREMIFKRQEPRVAKRAESIARELGLPPEQAAALKELLLAQDREKTERQLGGIGSQDLQSAATLSAALGSEHQAELKAFLGEGKYGEYRKNEERRSNQARIDRLKGQFASSQAPLQEQQVKPLDQLMQEERRRVTAPASGSGALLTPEALERQVAWQQQVNQRVLARATAFLTPAQIRELELYQASQIERQRRDATRTQQFFGLPLSGPASR